MRTLFAGFRKKRIAPSPPTTRPVSSAISTQALERIVDSEASSTCEMNPSKPSSDIGAPTKTSSDIEFLQANSNIGVSSQSMLELDRKSKSEVATYKFDNIQQNRVAKTSVEARSEIDSVDRKLAKADVDAIAPVEVAPKVEQARVAMKRGKLACLIALLLNFKARDPSGESYQSEDIGMNDITCHIASLKSIDFRY